ncbi:MAG: glycosyltransferase family 2 protein [Solirubrobacteraceae bacterium]
MPDVVLPVLDELEAIPRVLAAMPAGYTPIVVDTGTTDGSGALARQLGARVVYEPRRGFGAACHAGLMAASDELVCFMDCDASLDPGELPALVARVRSGGADLVLGRRRPTPGSWPAHARAANALLALILRARAGVRLRDLGPMRVARREALLALDVRDRAFGYPLEMVLRASRAGWRIEELPVSYLPRAGRSKVTGTIRGTFRAVRDMAHALSQ